MAFSYDSLTCLSSFILPLCLSFLAAYVILLPPHKKGVLLGKRYLMPPGPQGRPVVGSLLQWLQVRSRGNLGTWLMEQGRYGELTTLSMGTKTWILLNSGRVVNEIIAKRANITHERPYFPIAGTLVSRNKRVFLQKTEEWRESRRLLHQLLMGAGSKDHGSLVELASLGLLRSYLNEPEAWYAHNYRYPAAIVYNILTNKPLHKSRAELETLQQVTSTFLTSINTSFIEFFPLLNLLPKRLQFWRQYWEEMGTFHYNVFKHWWDGMGALRDPDSGPSFLRDSILKDYSGTEEQAMYLAIFAVTAGADNPRMTINAWVMACLAYPAAMQRARDELEGICGNDAHRLPSLSDLPNLPYMCAMVKEVLRWRPTVPLIPQRVLVEDLEFEGYKFPAGTEFLVNNVAVCRGSYHRPAEFIPERWLEGDNKEHGSKGTSDIEQDLWQFAFSAGRRSCVGYKLAQKELFVAFARVIYCFDISPAGEFDNRKLNAFDPGEPFPAKVTVRSPAHERLILDEAAKCDIWGE
ncbi:cytochrome P450 2C31 [Hypoxylon sp. NC0597]|nr:cytochrome P450 2C31 [Hypoxylon sp. NC0597]